MSVSKPRKVDVRVLVAVPARWGEQDGYLHLSEEYQYARFRVTVDGATETSATQVLPRLLELAPRVPLVREVSISCDACKELHPVLHACAAAAEAAKHRAQAKAAGCIPLPEPPPRLRPAPVPPVPKQAPRLEAVQAQAPAPEKPAAAAPAAAPPRRPQGAPPASPGTAPYVVRLDGSIECATAEAALALAHLMRQKRLGEGSPEAPRLDSGDFG